MPLLTKLFYEITQAPRTRQYIETGVYKGEGIKSIRPYYQHVHGIELAEKYYEYNVKQFQQDPGIQIHLGDSKKILPKLLSQINEPVTIHLDAHFSGGETAFGEEHNSSSNTPLLDELKILKKRSYNDVIIIDDCRMVGNSGREGDGSEQWPFYDYDWTNITEKSIRKCMKYGYEIFKNSYGEYSSGPRDQWIITPLANYDHIMYVTGKSKTPAHWIGPRYHITREF